MNRFVIFLPQKCFLPQKWHKFSRKNCNVRLLAVVKLTCLGDLQKEVLYWCVSSTQHTIDVIEVIKKYYTEAIYNTAALYP